MDQLNLYRIFIRVVETRSFTRAADTLQMPRSSVSTAIADLEARMGARLLNRTTRMVAPTDEGEEFYERCTGFLAEGEEMESMFRTASRRIEGRIRVDLPGRIGRLIVAPALPDFLALGPGIRVELGMARGARAPQQSGAVAVSANTTESDRTASASVLVREFTTLSRKPPE